MAINIFVDDPEQAAFEAKSVEVFQTPEVQEQLNAARKLFGADPLAQTPSGRATLERSVSETVCAALDWIVNDDPIRPSFVWVQTPPHKWFGVDFPGNRWGIDNPDNIYATACIDGDSRYVIRGKLRHPGPAECTFTVMGRGGPYPAAFPHSNGYLSLADTRTSTDGSFEITVDSSPAGGRPNHIQSRPESLAFLLRHSLGDWSTETPPLVSIERVGGPAARPAPGKREMVKRAVEKLREYIPAVLDFNRKACYRLPANELTVPGPTPGGLLTQITSFGHFQDRRRRSAGLDHQSNRSPLPGLSALRPLADRDGIHQRHRMHQSRAGRAQRGRHLHPGYLAGRSRRAQLGRYRTA